LTFTEVHAKIATWQLCCHVESFELARDVVT
jgi:hypothetical protein